MGPPLRAPRGVASGPGGRCGWRYGRAAEHNAPSKGAAGDRSEERAIIPFCKLVITQDAQSVASIKE